MYGGGCPNCSGSKGEIKIRDFLDNLDLSYEREFSFEDLWGDCDRQLRFDFAVFNEDDSIKCLIEYDGIQHFKPINFWGMNTLILKLDLKHYNAMISERTIIVKRMELN